MKIYHQYANNYLREQSRIIQASPQRWRCIYFHFSHLDESYTAGLRTNIVVNIFKDLLRDYSGFVYLCDDGDIVILFQGMVAPILEKLGDHVQGLILAKRGTTPDVESLCEVMELRIHWDRFEALCQQKTNMLNHESQPTEGGKLNVPEKPYRWDADLFSQATLQRLDRPKTLALVVEDDPFTRRLVVNALRPDFDVLEAGDGKTALHLYNLNAPDMVFQDIELPDSNGHLLLQEMIEYDADAFIVMLSGNSQKENVIAALEDGAQGFVTKPFPKEKLLHYANSCSRVRTGRTLAPHVTVQHSLSETNAS